MEAIRCFWRSKEEKRGDGGKEHSLIATSPSKCFNLISDVRERGQKEKDQTRIAS